MPGSAIGAAHGNFDNVIDAVKKRFSVNDISWYVQYYTAIRAQGVILMKHFISKGPTQLFYNDRSAFDEDRITAKIWIFETGIESEINITIFDIKVSQKRTLCKL